MASIIFNVAEFQCESPLIGTTYRNQNNWIFNWTSKWDEYLSLGIDAKIRLYYNGDNTGNNLYQGTSLPIPGNAASFTISDLPNFDRVNFQIIFDVEDGNICNYTFNIPNSSIVIT